MSFSSPPGYILSEAALYSFQCQDVYPDVVSFAAAIPDHLKPIFLIPVSFQLSEPTQFSLASSRFADGIQPSGDTPEGDLFSYKSFVNEDAQGTIPNSSPGSIFEINDADSLTHHQEYNWDENIQAPTDTSYLSDIDITQYIEYPYRTKEKPVRKSSDSRLSQRVAMVKVAIKYEDLERKAPGVVKDRAKPCSVSLNSYNNLTRVYLFFVNCGNGVHLVRAGISDLDHVILTCSCKFWRWNGPEHHAKRNKYLLGLPHGTATPPRVRDPENKYWLCKHSYAVLKKLESFMVQIIDENWDKEDSDLMQIIDDEWDRLSRS